MQDKRWNLAAVWSRDSRLPEAAFLVALAEFEVAVGDGADIEQATADLMATMRAAKRALPRTMATEGTWELLDSRVNEATETVGSRQAYPGGLGHLARRLNLEMDAG